MTQFKTLPPFGADQRQVAEVLRGAMDGKTNNTGRVTLNTGNAVETTFYDSRIGYDSLIYFVPISAAAKLDTAPHGVFSMNATQTTPTAFTPDAVQYDTTEVASGVYLSNGSRINVRNSGLYMTMFSLQLANDANSTEYADIWFRINGTDVVRSASRFDLPPRKSTGDPSFVIANMQLTEYLTAGDYVEIAGLVSSTDVFLQYYPATTSPARPAIPAAIVSIQYASSLAATNIYVTSQQQGQATIRHWANDTADKTYGYIIVG